MALGFDLVSAHAGHVGAALAIIVAFTAFFVLIRSRVMLYKNVVVVRVEGGGWGERKKRAGTFSAL